MDVLLQFVTNTLSANMYYYIEKTIIVEDLGYNEVSLCNIYLPRTSGKRIYVLISGGLGNFIWKEKTYTLLRAVYSNGRAYNFEHRQYIPINLKPSHGKVILTLLDENQNEISGEAILHFQNSLEYGLPKL